MQESPFFGRNETLSILGNSAEVRRVAFETKVGDLAPVVALPRGYAFFRVLEEKPSRVPSPEEVKDKVKADVLKSKAMALAKAKAEASRTKLDKSVNAAAVAKAEGLELKTQEGFLRSTQLPEAGRSPSVERAAFENEIGTLSQPLPSDLGYVLLWVRERSGFTPEAFASEKESFTERQLEEKRSRVWNAFVQDLEKRLDVKIHRDAMQRLLG